MKLLWQRDRSRKPVDSFRQQHETWRQAYADACTLRERFPKVEEIVFDMVFRDSKALGTYSPQLRRISASAKAFFAIPCPRTLCLEGGFDLDSAIRIMLRCGGTTSSGALECQGWIDPARASNAHCLLQLHYRIEVCYHTPTIARRDGAPV